MNKKMYMKLGHLKIELDAYVLMSQLVFSLQSEQGVWRNVAWGKKMSEEVLYWDDIDDVGIGIHEDGTYHAFNSTPYDCEINVPKLVEVIDELMPKFVKDYLKKLDKKKSAKKSNKKSSKKVKQDTSPAGIMKALDKAGL